MFKKLSSCLIVLSLCAAVHAQQRIDGRVALVIGIQNYVSISPLRNSLNDAHDMASTLRKKGFEVIELYDPSSKRELTDGLRRYFSRVKDHPDLAGLIYYSGHGVQVDGANYLIPTKADPQIKADLDDQCVRMDFVMQVLGEAGNSLNILIMDACRNNPFRGFSRSTDRGLSVVDTPKGSYIVYATKPGSVASDGEGVNGLFTSKLLKYINEPDLNIEQVFKKVAKDVADESHDAQRPWISSDYTGDFYFSGASVEKQKVEIKASEETVKPITAAPAPVREVVSVDELFTRANSALAGGNVSDALFNYERAASAGHIPSALILGNLYRKSASVEQNYTKSLSWFMKAAEANNAEAQNAVGEFYLNGWSVRDDYPAAMSWFQKAAASNYPPAQFNIGMLYLNGRGVNKSEPEAMNWFTKAADQNLIVAENKLGSMYLFGGETVRKDKTEALRWFKKAASQGDTWAKETLVSLGY